MLVIWRDSEHVSDDQQRVDTTAELDTLLDRLHRRATADHYPHYVFIYAGNRYPEEGHGRGDRWIPADPGDGPQPEILFTVGNGATPVYWNTAGGDEYSSKGPDDKDEPEFEYFYGGQESYAPAWSLIPHDQAREAARIFVASNGQRPDNITWRAEDTN